MKTYAYFTFAGDIKSPWQGSVRGKGI